MPRKARGGRGSYGTSGTAQNSLPQFQGVPDDRIYKFTKDEIVWAKMKFFSAWPAKVTMNFTVRAENYKKKKMVPPKQQVDFFDNPPTIGEIHHNQIFKFVDNYKKFGQTNNKKLQLGIRQAKEQIPPIDRERIKFIERDMKIEHSDQTESEDEDDEEAEDEDRLSGSEEAHLTKALNNRRSTRKLRASKSPPSKYEQVRPVLKHPIFQMPKSMKEEMKASRRNEKVEEFIDSSSSAPVASRKSGEAKFNKHEPPPSAIEETGAGVMMGTRSSCGKLNALRKQPEGLAEQQEVQSSVDSNKLASYLKKARLAKEQHQQAKGIKAATSGVAAKVAATALVEAKKEIVAEKVAEKSKIPDKKDEIGENDMVTGKQGNESMNKIEVDEQKQANGECKAVEKPASTRDREYPNAAKEKAMSEEDKGDKDEEKQAEMSPRLSTKPKRTPKPTQVYEMFQTQQLQNKRIKKQNEKEREQKRLKKLQEEKDKQEAQAAQQQRLTDRAQTMRKQATPTARRGDVVDSSSGEEDAGGGRDGKDGKEQISQEAQINGQKDQTADLASPQRTSKRTAAADAKEAGPQAAEKNARDQRQSSAKQQQPNSNNQLQNARKGDEGARGENLPSIANKRSSTAESRTRREQKDARQGQRTPGGASGSGGYGGHNQLSLQKEQSSCNQRQVTIGYPQNSNAGQYNGNVRNENKEKIKKMKDIKKYFDSIFREIKEVNKEILNQNEDFQDGLPPVKSKQRKDKEAEALKKAIEKAYHQIRLNCKHIDQHISVVFREYNELSLMHESKLGHALKDMQQFLEYQQSSDETIQSIQAKLDMIINIQEKRMFIEIFGEYPLDSFAMKKHAMGAAAEPSNRPSIGLSSEAFAGGYTGRQSHELKFCQPNLRQHMSESTSKLHSKAKGNLNEGDDSIINESLGMDHQTTQEVITNSEFQLQDQKHQKLDADETSHKKSSKKKLKKHSSDYRRESFKSRHRQSNAGIVPSILGNRPSKHLSSGSFRHQSDLKRLKSGAHGLQRSRLAALMGVPSGAYGGSFLPGNTPPLMLSNLIQNQIKMDIQNIQKQQLIKQLQTMQSFSLNSNFQNMPNPLQQMQSIQQLAHNQFPQPSQAPSQSLNLTILNNGQNFMNLPGSASGGNLLNVQNMQQMSQNQMLFGQFNGPQKLQPRKMGSGPGGGDNVADPEHLHNMSAPQMNALNTHRQHGGPERTRQYNPMQEQINHEQNKSQSNANAVDFLNNIDRMQLKKLIQQQQQQHPVNPDSEEAQSAEEEAGQLEDDDHVKLQQKPDST